MPISFECDVCFKKYRVPDNRAGQRLKCKECGSPLHVPGGNADYDDFADEPAPLPSRRPRPATKKKKAAGGGGAGLIIGMALAAVVLIGGGIGAGIYVINTLMNNPNGATAAADGSVDAAGDANAATAESANAAEAQAVAAAVPATGAPAAPATPAATPTPTASRTTRPPKPAVVIPEWSLPEPVASAAVDWPERFPRPYRLPPAADTVLFSRIPNPFMVFGKEGYSTAACEVFDVTTGKSFGKLRVEPENALKVAVSADGKWMVNQVLANPEDGLRFQVCSFETGEFVNDFKYDVPKLSVTFLDFGPDQSLLIRTIGQVDGEHRNRLEALDIVTAESRWTMDQADWLDDSHADFTPDGHYLVSLKPSQLTICDVREGKLLGQTKIPNSSINGYGYTPVGVAVSMSGNEIAVAGATVADTHIFVYGATDGNLIEEVGFPGHFNQSVQRSTLYDGPAIEWLPDDSGWLLGGRRLIDRESGRTLWTLRTIGDKTYDLHNDYLRQPVPGGLLYVDGPKAAPQIRFMPVKLPELREIVAGMEASEKAVLKPGSSVSLQVELGTLRFGDADTTVQELKDVIAQRLELDGFVVEDDQPVQFVLKYSESAGNQLSQSTRPFGRPGAAPAPNAGAGGSVQATNAAVGAGLLSADGKKVYWSEMVNIDPRFLIIRGEATDAAARNAMFDNVKDQLLSLSIPYYIEPGTKGQTLPEVAELPYK